MANMSGHDAGAVGGGAASFFGGAPSTEADPARELREYEASISSKTKEDFIRRLGRALQRSGLVATDPDGDLDAIVKAMVDMLPNPSTNGKRISEKSEVQAAVCRRIAEVLNDEFTPGASKPEDQLIDVSLSPAAVCEKVWEWIRSFTAGVKTEFLSVHASVRNVMKSLAVLREVMEEAYKKIQAAATRDADAETGPELEALAEVYSRAQSERTRQEEMLKNLLNVRLMPAMNELEAAMRDESSQNALIKKLGLAQGTKGFGNSLAAVISGLGSAANIANRVHRALKAAGVSVSEYLNSKDFADFQRLLDSRIESGSIPAEDLAKFLTAAQTLRANFDTRADAAVKAALEGPTTGGAPGDEDDPSKPKSTLDKRVAKLRTEKKLIVRDFVTRMARHYDEVLAAVKALGPELGRKIPITDKTDALRDALLRLRDMREARIELALVGYYADANARERKERFIAGLRLVSATCTDLMNLEAFRDASSLLAGLKAAIDSLEKTVNYFSDVLTKKFGGDGGDDVTGGADGDLTDADLLPEIARSTLSLNDAVNEFVYFYYVARVRANLLQSAKEVDAFGEKYTSLLGDAVAANMINLRAERVKVEKALAERGTAGTPATTAFPATDAGNKDFAAAKEFVAREYAVKDQLYRALQAVDLYLKEFSAGIARDPDAIRGFKKMLDGTEVIARWFNETTGENLWHAFEYMDSVDAAGKVPSAAGAAALASTANSHYYEKVAQATVANGMTFGVPTMGVAPSVGANVQKSINATLEMFQALKNLVNAFARIGSQFGGADIRSKVFMSPMQIYKALMDYLRLSALSLNTGSGGAVATIPSALTGVGLGMRGAAISIAVADAITPFQVYFGSVGANLAGNFEREDRYFAIIIKSMAAKILTTLGVFDMFERRTPLYQLTPTRQIIGGAGDFGGDETPEALEDAAELYFRLPRLVEFYRRLLDRNFDATTAMKVTMLPEIEGVFSGLIRVIFLRMANPSSGDYSDTELREVVREINMIHSHFREKDGERAIHAAVNALVEEVNRRFGIVKKEEMDKYLAMIRRTGQQANYGEYNNTNYAILPDEDEAATDRRAPSDRYALAAAMAAPLDAAAAELAGRVQLDPNVNDATSRRMMLRDFRTRLEKEFAGFSAEAMGTSFTLLISQAAAEIRRAAGVDAKFAVAAKLIQGSGGVALDSGKLLMFHETAVVSLNTVSAIHSLITQFEARMKLLDADRLCKRVMDALATSKAAGNAAPTGLAALIALDPELAQSSEYLLGAGAPARRRTVLAAGTAAGTAYGFLAAQWAGLVAGGAAPSTRLGETDPTVQTLALFARIVVNHELMMRDYIENLFDIADSGLVEVRFPAGGAAIQISFAKLRALAETLLSDAKFFIDTFRPHIDRTVLDRFENSANKGSVYWLEKNLVDLHFRGTSEEPPDQARTLEGISRLSAAAFASLVRDTKVPLSGGIAAASLVPLGDANAQGRFETYGELMSELVFYDASTPYAPATTGARLGYSLGELIGPAAGSVFQSRLALYDSNVTMSSSHSLMFALNQLLSYYIAMGTDPAGARKVYLPLINAFANGIAARSVATPEGNTFPDLSTAAAIAMGARGDPANGAILFESLAWVLQRLIKDVNPTTQVSIHLTTTLTDVPLYLKEGMRANLPGFIRLFGLVGQKGEFIKQLMQKTTINCARGAQPASTVVSLAPDADKGLRAMDGALSSADMKSRLAEIIDSIDSAAYTLATSAGEVLKELGDTPVYLQTQEGSIEMYKQRYGKTPLMPLSSTLYFLTAPAASALFPRTSLGEPTFKLQYGVRGLLAGSMPVELDRCPGAKSLLDSYNATSAKREQIEAPRYIGFARGVVAAMRWIVEARNYKTVLATSPRVFSAPALVDGDNGIQTGAAGNAAYAIGKTEQAIVTQVESSNQDEEINKIVAIVGKAGAPGSSEDARKREQILSILEMNIVPIKAAALMRDIPLANLFNFEYTFEQMAAAFFGEAADQFTDGTITDATTVRTRQMFLRLLANPYLDLHTTDTANYAEGIRLYGSDMTDLGSAGFVHRIFRGDNDLGLGRPKFLSDQLFNKALFGSTYVRRADFDEAGPGVGAGIERGRARRGVTPLTTRLTGEITYLDSDAMAAPNGPETAVRVLDFTEEERKGKLEAIGRARFDTRLVRNLFFISNVLRLVRAKLSRELTQSRNVVVSSHAAVAAGVTEYGSDPFGPNEVYGSMSRTGETRSNDQDALY
jgi:hypothetical protein